MARVGLLDVPRHERGPGAEGAIRRQHQQPQLRRPARCRRKDAAGEPADGSCLCRPWMHYRSPRADVGAVAVEPIKTLHSRTVVLPASDVDTDQIIPARFLTTTTRS